MRDPFAVPKTTHDPLAKAERAAPRARVETQPAKPLESRDLHPEVAPREDGGPRINEHGVYIDYQVLELLDNRGDTKKPQVAISLAHDFDGWRFATRFNFTTGNSWGQSAPIMKHDTPYASREVAVMAGLDELRARLEPGLNWTAAQLKQLEQMKKAIEEARQRLLTSEPVSTTPRRARP